MADPVPYDEQYAERIEIENPSTIFPYIEAYPEESPKQHHFRFRRNTDYSSLLQKLNALDVMVEEPHKNQKEDIHLVKNGESMGKMHFIHFNKRDRSHPEKYYVHIYLYGFRDKTLFDKVKDTMKMFFRELSNKEMQKAVPHAVPNQSIMGSKVPPKVHTNSLLLYKKPASNKNHSLNLLPKPFTPMVSLPHPRRHTKKYRTRKHKVVRKSKPTCKRRYRFKRVTCKRQYRKKKFDSRRRK